MVSLFSKDNQFTAQTLSLLSWHKWLGLVATLTISMSLFGMILASPFFSLFGFLALGSILTRIHSCKSPFDISIIGVGSLLLTMSSGIWAGVSFGMLMWFATMIWQPYAEFSYHFPNALATAITVLLFSFLQTWSCQNLVMLAVFYGLVRFVVYALMLSPILRPGTMVPDFIFNAQELPFNLLYNAFAMQVVGFVLLPLTGVSGWEVGSFITLLQSVVSWF